MTQLNVSNQIAALATKIASDRATVETLVKSLDEKPNDTTITAQVDQLSAAVIADSATLVTLQNAERALMARALPSVAPGIITSRPKEKITAEHLFRGAVVAAEAYYSRRPVEEIVKTLWPDSAITLELCTLQLNRDVEGGGFQMLTMDLLTRAAQNPAMTNVPGYAQELVHQTYAAFLDVLKPVSAVAQVDFNSGSFASGSPIVVPFRAPRAAFPDNFEAAFRAEGAPIRVGRLTTGSKSLYPYSMGVIGTMTRELLRRSSPKIDDLTRQAMIDDTAEIMDNVIFGNGAAVVGVRPAGLTNGIAAGDTAAATATPTFADIDRDLQGRVVQLTAVRRLGGPKTSWVMNKANAIKLGGLLSATGVSIYGDVTAPGARLKGFPLALSTSFPVDQVLLVDGAGLFMAGGVPEFEMSFEATIHEENTTPLPIGTAGTPAVVAAPVRSLFQTNSAALRMIEEISWDTLRTGAVQQLTGVAW